ncbi:MAG: LL-diaminopimelate aminotransferase [archaeon]|jgi:LL-diaminopimelate aminotransferase
MVKTNSNYDKLAAGYLFPEIAKRTKLFQEKNPGVQVMRLGIGNTTEPLASSILKALQFGVEKLGKTETYTGYGDEQGDARLRKAIANFYSGRGVSIEADEVFVSDGAKPDSANIQSIFSEDSVIAVQDPAYPVYVDSNVIAGRSGESINGTYRGFVYMPCNEKNGFFPSVPEKKVDLIYLCSPNNPTGAVATKMQLKKFVDYAMKNKAIIIFDAAYAIFITDESLPKSIYEIDGAKECAIEINSFSKSAGFTGVRLGWSIVPKSLVAEGASPGKINSLWNRRQCTMFNGASNIAQEGGIASLSAEGLAENKKIVDYYLENAGIIKKGLEEKGLKVFGGINAPYLWVKTPGGMKSWDFFDKILSEAHVVVTPGSGFGPSGEGYFRVSAFGHRENILKAVESVKNNLKV